jgi:hypothetical protein
MPTELFAFAGIMGRSGMEAEAEHPLCLIGRHIETQRLVDEQRLHSGGDDITSWATSNSAAQANLYRLYARSLRTR